MELFSAQSGGLTIFETVSEHERAVENCHHKTDESKRSREKDQSVDAHGAARRHFHRVEDRQAFSNSREWGGWQCACNGRLFSGKVLCTSVILILWGTWYLLARLLCSAL